MENEKVFAVIPAYNTAKTLEKLILQLRECISGISIVIVDDGSTDGTAEIIKQLEVISVEHELNLGKGTALKRGIHIALLGDAEFIFTLDSDGQHNPAECQSFIDKMVEEQLDLVIGSRMSNLGEMPFHRRISNKLTSRLISYRINQQIPDSQSGFRLYRAKVLKSIDLCANKFEIESEMLIKAALKGFKVGSINIEAIYPRNHISSVRVIDIFRFLRLFIQSFFW